VSTFNFDYSSLNIPYELWLGRNGYTQEIYPVGVRFEKSNIFNNIPYTHRRCVALYRNDNKYNSHPEDVGSRDIELAK